MHDEREVIAKGNAQQQDALIVAVRRCRGLISPEEPRLVFLGEFRPKAVSGEYE